MHREEYAVSPRLELCRRRAAEAGCPLAYVNMVGGQDELVFDGDSIVVDAAGALLARGPQFAEALIVADLEVAPAEAAAGGHAAPGDYRADARDGTTMTIRRLELAAAAPAAAVTEPPDPAGPVWPRLDELAVV